MFVAKIQILLNGSLIYVHPVLMKSVDEFCVEGRSKNFEVRVPLRPTKKDDVVAIDLSYAGHNPAIERLKLRVQFAAVKIMSNWFVEQIVSDNCRLISITRCKLAPDVNSQILALGVFRNKG